jgi:hypothetical protein
MYKKHSNQPATISQLLPSSESGYCLIRVERMVIFMAVRGLLSNINIIAKYERKQRIFLLVFQVEVKIVTDTQ